jgi:hypothetical protein
MNFPNQPETAAQLIARYGPQRTGPFAKLRPHADFILELRRNRASYDTIVAILRERHGLETSDTTVRKFCRQVLREPPPKRRGKRPLPSGLHSISPQPTPKPQLDGPQIAEVEFTDDP